MSGNQIFAINILSSSRYYRLRKAFSTLKSPKEEVEEYLKVLQDDEITEQRRGINCIPFTIDESCLKSQLLL